MDGVLAVAMQDFIISLTSSCICFLVSVSFSTLWVSGFLLFADCSSCSVLIRTGTELVRFISFK